MNLRPSGYEPDELPGCSTPRRWACWRRGLGACVGAGSARRRGFGPRITPAAEGSPARSAVRGSGGVGDEGLGEPGGDLLFRVLRRSTIGAEGFHGRVRDGIGCLAPRCGHQAGQTSMRPRARRAVLAEWSPGLDPGPSGLGPRGLARGMWARDQPGRFASMTSGKCLSSGIGPGGRRVGAGMALAAARGRVSGCPGGAAIGSGGFERLVPVSCTDCSASTSGLSTWWSSTALDETWF